MSSLVGWVAAPGLSRVGAAVVMTRHPTGTARDVKGAGGLFVTTEEEEKGPGPPCKRRRRRRVPERPSGSVYHPQTAHPGQRTPAAPTGGGQAWRIRPRRSGRAVALTHHAALAGEHYRALLDSTGAVVSARRQVDATRVERVVGGYRMRRWRPSAAFHRRGTGGDPPCSAASPPATGRLFHRSVVRVDPVGAPPACPGTATGRKRRRCRQLIGVVGECRCWR